MEIIPGDGSNGKLQMLLEAMHIGFVCSVVKVHVLGNNWNYAPGADYSRRYDRELSLGFTLGEALSVDIYLEGGKWKL